MNEQHFLADEQATLDLGAALASRLGAGQCVYLHGDLGAGLDIHSGEGLPVEAVHPLRHVLHAASEDASDRFVGADPDLSLIHI